MPAASRASPGFRSSCALARPPACPPPPITRPAGPTERGQAINQPAASLQHACTRRGAASGCAGRARSARSARVLTGRGPPCVRRTRHLAQALCAAIEGFTTLLSKNPGYKAGDYLGASEYMDADDLGWQRYQLAELNNGRLAMMGIIGLIYESAAFDKFFVLGN